MMVKEERIENPGLHRRGGSVGHAGNNEAAGEAGDGVGTKKRTDLRGRSCLALGRRERTLRCRGRRDEEWMKAGPCITYWAS